MGAGLVVQRPYYDSSLSNDLSPPIEGLPERPKMMNLSATSSTDQFMRPPPVPVRHNIRIPPIHPRSVRVPHLNRYAFEDYYLSKKLYCGKFSTVYRATRLTNGANGNNPNSTTSTSTASSSSSLEKKRPSGASSALATERFAVKEVLIYRMNRIEYEDFLYEISLLSHLSHPNILELKAIYEPTSNASSASSSTAAAALAASAEASGSKAYTVTEYLKGGEILSILSNLDYPYSYYDVIYCFQQLFSAIHYLHGHGIIHRNILPETIIFQNRYNPRIRKDNRIKLVGFDYARCVFEKEPRPIHRVWSDSLVCPPEFQFNEVAKADDLRPISTTTTTNGGGSESCRRYDHSKSEFACDIWNFASLFYACLTTHVPFQETNTICHEPIWGKLPAKCTQFFQQALRINPLQRISADEIVIEHRNWLLREISDTWEGDIVLDLNMKTLKTLQNQREFDRQLSKVTNNDNTPRFQDE